MLCIQRGPGPVDLGPSLKLEIPFAAHFTYLLVALAFTVSPLEPLARMYIRYSTEYFKYGIPYECALVGARVDTFPENSDLTRLHITQHFPDQVTGTNLPLNAIYSVHTLVSGLLISTKKVWNKACTLQFTLVASVTRKE